MTLQPEKSIAVTDFSLPEEIIQLYNAANIRNVNEGIAVLFHAFLLESGFIPKDVSQADIYKLLPRNWKANDIFKIKYSHYCCPSFTCYMTCVPLYDKVSVHGIICDSVCSESVDLKMNLSKYIIQKKDLSNVHEVFSCVNELSIYFKDKFCLPLLNLLHETIGDKPLYGFPGLYNDLKILILMVLPVESIVSMSSVNKNLYNLVNLPFLWKYLFNRDFAKDGIPEIKTSSKSDWKEMYIKEYMRKKRKPSQFKMCKFTYPIPWIRGADYKPSQIFDPRSRLSQIFGHDLDSDLYINFDPPFPGLSSRIPPLRNPHFRNFPPYLPLLRQRPGGLLPSSSRRQYYS